MITIQTNKKYRPEKEYIYSYIMGELLGINYQIIYNKQKNTLITTDGKYKLIIPDILFNTPENDWLTDKSLPKPPLQILDVNSLNIKCPLVDQKIPVIYGVDRISIDQKNILPIDVFGSAFYMLSRYEEISKKHEDAYNRFPASRSLAYKGNFLERPIINEYVEMLWFELKKRWPGLERKIKKFEMIPTHDVDRPFQFALLKPVDFIKKWIQQIHKGEIVQGHKNMVEYLKARVGIIPDDPFNTFDWILDYSEKNSTPSTFYFFGKAGFSKFDGCYDPSNKIICKLIKNIYDRGHNIGLHGSFYAYKDLKQLNDEFENLKLICEQYRNNIRNWGFRQHYLRFNIKKTPAILEKIGLSYDSTLTFAEHGGFRSGICYEYPLYDITQRRALNLREQPLLIMERSILSPIYMNLNYYEAQDFILKIKERCKLFNGSFVFLWHNNMLLDDNTKELYQSIFTR